MRAPTYLIGRIADPLFAIFIGTSAAATRILREEKEKKGHGVTLAATGSLFLGRLREGVEGSFRKEGDTGKK